MEDSELYSRIKDLCLSLGASLFGIADIANVKDEFFLPVEIIRDFERAVSIGYRLNRKVLEGIQDRPTRIYYHHYRQVNFMLDRMALGVASYIQDHGYQALPIPASQIVDWEKQIGHLSHKKIAWGAGVGWRGRNNLIVNANFGAQMRLVTILTDIPSTCDQPVEKDCEDCHACISVCPANAIKERAEDFDREACRRKLKEFRKLGYTDQYICGICVKACKRGDRHS